MGTKGTHAIHVPPRGSVAQAWKGELPIERAPPPSDTASDQDPTTTIGIEPGHQAPLRRSCPHPEECHRSPDQLEYILKSKAQELDMWKRRRKIEQGLAHMERQRMPFLDHESWGCRAHELRFS